jgi:hypothetical protein
MDQKKHQNSEIWDNMGYSWDTKRMIWGFKGYLWDLWVVNGILM